MTRSLGFTIAVVAAVMLTVPLYGIGPAVSAVDDLGAAQRVVHATVVSADSAWERDASGNSHIYTTYVLAVHDVLKGPADSQITLRLRGGTVGDITEWISHSIQLTKGTDAVFLIDEGPRRTGRLRRVLAIENGRVFVDNARVDLPTLKGALRDRNLQGAMLEQAPHDAPLGTSITISRPSQPGAREQGFKEPRTEVVAPEAGQPVLLDPAAGGAAAPEQPKELPLPSGGPVLADPDAMAITKPRTVSATAITATMYDAWWSNSVDSDGDGYVRSSRLTWDADVVGSTGSLSVYFKIYYKLSTSSSWSLLSTSGVFTITGASSTDTVYMDITSGGHALYDWRIEVFRNGLTTYDAARDSSDDSNLNDVPMETAAEDTLAATAILYDAWWTNPVDSDGDGYVQSARLNWDADVSGSSGSLTVYFKTYYKLASSSTWTLLNTSGNFTITGSASSDSVGLDVTGGGHNLYDWRIEVFRSGQSSYDAARDPSNDSNLNDYAMETPAEDTAAATILYDAWWTSPVDSDGDGYVRSARLNWDADVAGGTGTLTVYFKTYYKLASSGTWTLLNTSGNFTITGSSSSDSVGIDLTGGGHNLYDWRIEVYRSGQTILDAARDPSTDADLNDYRMETAAEDGTAAPSITSISPTRASAGTQTSITIFGTNFGASQGSSRVDFFYRSGQPNIVGPVISWTNSQVVAQVPTGIVNNYHASAGTGPVTIVTSQGTSNGATLSVPFGFIGSRWPGVNPVITYRIGANFPQAQYDAIRRTFETWNLNAGVLFSYGGNTQTGADISDDGETEIISGSAQALCGGGTNIIGCANCFIQGGATLRDCDLVLNSDFLWSTATPTPNTNPSTFDVETIVLHEVGHWLTLNDLYGDDSNKVMYGFNGGGSSQMKRTPTVDDAEGGTWIYGAPVAMATITNATASPSTINPSQIFTIQYSLNVLAAAKYILGASIRPTGTSTWTISDAAHDTLVDLPTGTMTRSRSFAVPGGTTPGSYDLGVALWNDRNGNGAIDGADVQIHLRTFLGAITVQGPPCTSFSISPPSAVAAPAAGSLPVTITGSPSGCTGGSWSAAGNGSWITVSPTSGSGSGSVTVSWTQNTSTSQRSGNASIAGNSFPVTQNGSSVAGFYLITPCRLVDSRNANGPYGGPSLASPAVRNIVVVGQCGIPSGIKALSLNFAAVTPALDGWFVTYPGPFGSVRPAVSTINYKTGKTLANNAIVPVSADGSINVYNNVTVATHFVIDVTGYFQ